MTEEKNCKECHNEDQYRAYHRFPAIDRHCGECIAEKVLKPLRDGTLR